jgi:hypothetical protein
VRRIELFALLLLLGCAPGCKKESDRHEGPHEAPTADSAASSALATGPSGLERCDAYLETAARCLEKSLDTDTLRADMEQYRKQAAGAASPAEREAVAIGCEVALEALGDDCPP